MTKQVEIWRSEFGDAYLERNQFDEEHIQQCVRSFSQILNAVPEYQNMSKILEVGCNNGRNLQALQRLSSAEMFGIEPNGKAREELLKSNILEASHLKDATTNLIPFADASMDFVFTCLVLIHVSEKDLLQSLKEMHRVSKRYILAIEYFSPTQEAMSYRGHDDLLFRRDYGSLYLDNFPDLRIVDYGFFWKRHFPCQNNTTWWLFEKT
jgi:spore coat polysaccharide biosynthesis protein SpsF